MADEDLVLGQGLGNFVCSGRIGSRRMVFGSPKAFTLTALTGG